MLKTIGLIVTACGMALAGITVVSWSPYNYNHMPFGYALLGIFLIGIGVFVYHTNDTDEEEAILKYNELVRER